MNICFISIGHISKLRGGIDRVTDVISKALIGRGHNVSLISLWSAVKGDKIEEYQYFLPSQDCVATQNKEFLKKFFENNNIQVIINQAETDSMLELICSTHGNIPIITCIHTDPMAAIKTIDDNLDLWRAQSSKIQNIAKAPYFFIRFLYQKYTRKKHLSKKYHRLYSSCDAVVLLSDGFKKTFIKTARIANQDKLYAISNPNSFEKVDTNEAKENLVLVVSRLDFTPKRIDRVLRVWQSIEQENKHWQLAILGDGPERDFYENLSRKLGLNNVTFTGTVSPLPYYQRASILCITSTHEGFSLAAAEALQNEVIPIAYNSYATISDIIEDKKNGFLIRPFSEKKYKETLHSLMIDNKLRENIRKNIRRINKNNKFDISLIVDKWEDLITKICTKNDKSN